MGSKLEEALKEYGFWQRVSTTEGEVYAHKTGVELHVDKNGKWFFFNSLPQGRGKDLESLMAFIKKTFSKTHYVGWGRRFEMRKSHPFLVRVRAVSGKEMDLTIYAVDKEDAHDKLRKAGFTVISK